MAEPAEFTSSTDYTQAHYDETHQRPVGRRDRAQDSVHYTVQDVSSRITGSCSRRASNLGSLKTQIVQLPNKVYTYATGAYHFYRKEGAIFRKEVLSGITVALLQVPESVAFSYVAGLNSMFGLYATVIMGMTTAIFGGKPAMISGAAGALAVVQKQLTDDDGPLRDLTRDERIQHVLMVLIIFGIGQAIFGALGLAKFFTLIPNTSMIGFLNGLAIIIFLAQMPTFKKCTIDTTIEDINFEECNQLKATRWLRLNEGETWMVLIIIFITMFTMHFFPKVPKIGKLFPASLVAIIVATAFEFAINRPFFDYPVRTVNDTAPIDGSLPTPAWPDVGPNADWGVIIQFSISLGAIGLFESVMTLQAVNEITRTPVTPSACNAESFAQGLANLLCGFLGAMGGDAMIGQSTINVLNGARYRLSAFTAGAFMLVIILAASPVIDIIPVASLAGVLFMVVLHTFYWPTFRLLFQLHLVDSIAIVLVTVLAIVTNLAIAVLSGIVWQALVSVWENGKLLHCTTTEEMHGEEIVKIYHFSGPMSFGSTREFRQFFTRDDDPIHIIVDFTSSLICDFSSVVAIRDVALSYREADKRLTLRGISPLSTTQLRRDRDWVLYDHPRDVQHKPDLQHLELLKTHEAVVARDGTLPADVLQDIIDSGDIEVEKKQV